MFYTGNTGSEPNEAPTESLIWTGTRPVSADFGGPISIPFEPFDEHWSTRPGIGRFAEMAQRTPEKIAIIDDQYSLTYSQVRSAVWDLARQVAAIVPKGRPVVALLRNDASFPIVFLAHLAIGRPIIPIDASHPADRQAMILGEAIPAAIILGRDVEPAAGLIPDRIPIIHLKKPAAIQEADGTEIEFASLCDDLTLNDLAGISYTSGSMGRPKGLAFSQYQFVASLSQYVNACHINSNDRILGLGSLSGAGSRDALAALMTGGTIVILDLKSVGVNTMLHRLAAEQITILAFVPSVLRALMQNEAAWPDFRSLRLLDLYGDRTTGNDIELFRRVLPEECAIRLSLASTEATDLFYWFVDSRSFEKGQMPPCGYLAIGKEVVLLDLDGRQVAQGEPGELVVRSQNIAIGGWQAGQLIPGAFVTDLTDPAMRIYHTGDVVRFLPDGMAEFLGRRDRQIKIKGLRADPAEAEAALRLADGINDVAVIAHDKGDDISLVAFIVLDQPTRLIDFGKLRRFLITELPDHLIPAEFYIVAEIPRLPNYKVDVLSLQRRLPANLGEGIKRQELGDAITEASNPAFGATGWQPVRHAVEAAWTRAFGERNYAEGRNLTEAGGDSLKLLTVIFEIERSLGRKIPIEIITSDLTPQQLIAAISRHIELRADTLPKDDRATIFMLADMSSDGALHDEIVSALSSWFKFETIDVASRSSSAEKIILSHPSDGPVHMIGIGRATHDVLGMRSILASRNQLGMMVLIDPGAGTDLDEALADRSYEGRNGSFMLVAGFAQSLKLDRSNHRSSEKLRIIDLCDSPLQERLIDLSARIAKAYAMSESES